MERDRLGYQVPEETAEHKEALDRKDQLVPEATRELTATLGLLESLEPPDRLDQLGQQGDRENKDFLYVCSKMESLETLTPVVIIY